MELALDLLAMDLTNDPDPVRFDGTPPQLEREPVFLTSLFDIAGYLVRKIFADTGDDDAVFCYINDHLGTPQIITDETGNIVWSAVYQPFGSVNAVVSELGNNFRFAGQYYDSETGLHYNYFRYYDPATGRYLRSDPIGLTGGINLYAYASNNSPSFIDPLGLLDWRSKRHTHRNKNNICPKKKPKKNCEGEFVDHAGQGWDEDMGWKTKDYHNHAEGYRTYRGKGKYIGSQCTYDKAGNLVDEGPFMGTYDYGRPATLLHYVVDVRPHEKMIEEGGSYAPGLTQTY